MLMLPNYQINSQIYESVNSLVYRGLRKKDNQPVILKMLKQDYPTPAELTRYRQEYEITHHFELSGLIKAYYIEKYKNTLVIILEDFGGQSLKSLFNRQKICLSDFVYFAIQIADSLANIHAANIIHKDINPSNIVVNPQTNQLKIIDFGIASRLPRENPTLKNPEQLEGTLAYLSPEQTGRINRSMDYRTDLYSLGITFYELLTGQLPFTATEAMELVHCHIAKTPTPLCEVNPDVPPIVSDIVLKLLAKNAEDRYQSAFGLKADFEKIEENLTGIEDLSALQFELAQNDFSGQFEIPQKLYGRENEVYTLLQAFERVNAGTAEMMLVAGYSGVGKTALVHEVHKPMSEKRGYFATGKFDQFQKNIPYSAITQAFNQFCRYLLLENTETLANWQSKLLDVLGNNGQIIIDVIPDLELVIGQQPEVAKVGPTETQNRFKMFFLNFIKTLCDKEHPFILFIDDLQWVDSASLGLLKSILLDDEMGHLLIIGAYRDNEVDSNHPFMMVVDKLQKANARINTIELVNLQREDINHLLQDSLKCEARQARALTDLIYQKTQGNAFFSHQFLQTLYVDALLRFDFEQLKWQWNIEQIAAQNITDNVVELMAHKIDKLPSSTSMVLQLAACIGNQFDLSMLAVIDESNKTETLEVLHPAIAEGLILPLDENYKHLDTNEKSQFNFLHDRVQQAAYALIDAAQKKKVHLQIARLLLKNTVGDALEDKVFEIVGQFNQSLELITEESEGLQLARLFLMAGQKAKMATAYGAAVNYLRLGRIYLTENSWETEYELTFNLFIESVEAAYLNGDFEQLAQLAQVVLKHAQTLEDEAKLCEIQIIAYIAQNQQPKAIKAALHFLKRLGINLPEKPTPEDIGTALQETQASLGSKSIPDLIDLPLMTAIKPLLAIRVMVAVVPAAYQVLPDLMILLVLKQIDLFLEHGKTYETSASCGDYGIILCGIVFEIELGYQFGQLALNLLQRLGDKRFIGRTIYAVNTFIMPWKEHAKASLEDLSTNYHTSLETGNLEIAGYSAHLYICQSFFVGKPLPSLESEAAFYGRTIARIKQKAPLSWLQISWRTVLNLMIDSNNPCYLTGKTYDERSELPLEQPVNDNTALCFFHLHKCMLHYLFNEYALAVENADKTEQHLYGVVSMLMMAIFYFYDSLTRLAVYSDSSAPEQQGLLDKVAANQEKMGKWAEHAPMNFLHKFYLVEAEYCRVLGKDGEAREYYDKAIELAQENEYLNEEALADELAGQFYLAKGKSKIAQLYLREAHYTYQQWGALAKVADLESKYPQWLVAEQSKMFESTFKSATLMASVSTQLQTSKLLDLDSVAKAAQTLAGEIVLSKLLEKMMHTLIQNAGAERGLLILDKEGEWVIEAEGTFHLDKVTVLQSISIENRLPTAIVNYVLRSLEPVVLSNAIQEGIYTEDSYIQQHQLKSVLCSPILHQGHKIGLLYLENNLIEGAFTPARLKIVDMLSSQAAISLENALLYKTLEQKVEQRTKQLADANQEISNANQEITLLNERLKKENLRMGAELDVAKQLQQMVLPKASELQQIDSLEIAGFMEPADEVGGDYYDVLEYNGHLKIGIGDVTGHGLESGVLMLMVQTAVRTLQVSEVSDPEKFLTLLNRAIYDNIKRIETDKNLTLSLLDYHNGTLQLTGQHEDVLLIHKDGQVERIDTFELGYSVGVVVDIANWVGCTEISLQPGEGIVLYTDGITEAQDADNEVYGIKRLCDVISCHWLLSAQAIQEAVINDVRQFIGDQKVFDDITLLVLKQK